MYLHEQPIATPSTTPSPRPVDEQMLIELRGVSKSFGDVRAVNDVSLEVSAGHILGLLGHNGAGKTTLIRLMTGLLEPDAGEIDAFGSDPVLDGPAVRKRLGVLPSSSIADVRLTGAENMAFAASLFDLPADAAASRSRDLLDGFGLSDRADDLVETYSAGMKQRLCLARVLLPDPEVLLLDEPTSAMDPVGARDFIDTLADFASDDRAIVLCTHDLAEASSLCSDVVVLSEGSVIAGGAPAELTRAIDVPTLIRVEPTASDRALRIVRSADPSADADSDGEITAPRLTRDAVPGIVEKLVHAGVAVFGVEQQSASLEDVYFDLHRPQLISDPPDHERSIGDDERTTP